jgi:hypothetical protein
MKFEELIKEETNGELYNKSLDEMLSEIIRDCKPYLQAVKSSGELLFRGFRNGSFNVEDMYGLKSIRKDREPRDLPMFIHNELEMLYKYHKVPSTRSNVAFATSNSTVAYNYIYAGAKDEPDGEGEVFVVIPKKFFYIKGLVDMYDDFEQFTEMGYNSVSDLSEDQTEILEDTYAVIEMAISSPGNIVHNKIPPGSKRSEEVYIYGDDYYYMSRRLWEENAKEYLLDAV